MRWRAAASVRLVPGASTSGRDAGLVRCVWHKAQGLGRFYVTCLLPELGQRPLAGGEAESPAVPGLGTCGAPCAPFPPPPPPRGLPCAERERIQARGTEDARGGCSGPGPHTELLTWRPWDPEPPGEVSARAALRRWGWGGRGSGPLKLGGLSQFRPRVSWLLPPACCRRGFLSRVSPPLLWPHSASPSPSLPRVPSSRLLQCGGCGYLVNCNCGLLRWGRPSLSSV